jgi:uncharacterized membrane protein
MIAVGTISIIIGFMLVLSGISILADEPKKTTGLDFDYPWYSIGDFCCTPSWITPWDVSCQNLTI